MLYSKIRKKLESGDIVLFSGKGRISAVIKWFTRSKWSHVGMIIKSEELDMLLLWESTTLSKIKTIHGEFKQGVAIRPLSEVLNSYNGEIGIRTLKTPLTDLDLQTLIEFREEVKDRPYEKSKLELFKSAWDLPFGQNEEDLSSIFCSELIAEYFMRIGRIPKQLCFPSNEVTPANFALLWTDIFNKVLPIERG